MLPRINPLVIALDHVRIVDELLIDLLSAGDDAESRAIVTPPPTSCASLAQLGNRVTGFYLVLDEESNNRIQTVYCDFALAFNNPSTVHHR